MATRKRINRRKRTGGRFFMVNKDKSPADNLKDFDRYWIGRIDPGTGKFYEYDPDTYYPGWTNPGMIPKKMASWNRPQPVTRTFQKFTNGEPDHDFPDIGDKVAVTTQAGTYMGTVVRRLMERWDNGVGGILLSGYNPITKRFEDFYIPVKATDRWRPINASFRNKSSEEVPSKVPTDSILGSGIGAKRTRGGFFRSINEQKSPADNLKDFDRYWIGRTTPEGGLYIVYDPNTYYPGWTNPGMMPTKMNSWGRPQPETRNFQSISDFPEMNKKVAVNTYGGTYIGTVDSKMMMNNNYGRITLLDAYSSNTNKLEKRVDIDVTPFDSWRPINASFREQTPSAPPGSQLAPAPAPRSMPAVGAIITVHRDIPFFVISGKVRRVDGNKITLYNVYDYVAKRVNPDNVIDITPGTDWNLLDANDKDQYDEYVNAIKAIDDPRNVNNAKMLINAYNQNRPSGGRAKRTRRK